MGTGRVAQQRIPDFIAPLGSVVWAAGEAARLLADLPDKWRHTEEVARHARWAAAGVPVGDRDVLVAAAFLHDIGYAASIAGTGFQPLDGARYLRQLGLDQLACLVGHHSGAAVEAAHRGLGPELAEFPRPVGAVADALTYSDVTSGPTGRSVSPGDRFTEILDRHGPDSVVAESRAEARALMYAEVARTLRRATAARPPVAELTITPVDLGCSTLIRLQGRLTAVTVPQALTVIEAALGQKPHVAVVDLHLLSGVDRDGANLFRQLGSIAGDTVDVVLVDAPQPHADLVSDAVRPGDPVTLASGIEVALRPHCG